MVRLPTREVLHIKAYTFIKPFSLGRHCRQSVAWTLGRFTRGASELGSPFDRFLRCSAVLKNFEKVWSLRKALPMGSKGLLGDTRGLPGES